MDAASPLIAREYVRVSYDRSGRLRSPQEQHDDNAALGAELGYQLNGESYAEAEAVSASRYGTKVRGEFARLVHDLEAGQFRADVLVLWESSRGSRKTAEWCALLDACESAGVRIAVTADERLYNPANGHDRRELLTAAVDSEHESYKTSKRIGRAAAASAAAGQPWGVCPFGYRREYRYERDPDSGKQVRVIVQHEHRAEAEIVRELFDRIRKGESLRSVARDFAARGVTGRKGKPLTAVTLRSMAMRPCYGGYRAHEAGRHTVHRGPVTDMVKAAWPPLVDAATFQLVRARLTGAGLPPVRGKSSTLLGNTGRCGHCGGALTTVRHHGELVYRCRERSCVRVPMADLDAVAEQAILAYASRKGNAERLTAPPDAGPELERAQAGLAAAQSELADLLARAKARAITVASFAALEPALAAAVTEAKQRLERLTVPAALAGMVPAGQTVAQWWEDAEPLQRRQAAKVILSPRWLGILYVDKAPVPGVRVPAKDRVRLDRGAQPPA